MIRRLRAARRWLSDVRAYPHEVPWPDGALAKMTKAVERERVRCARKKATRKYLRGEVTP